jgi:serine/threonine protein kinase
MKLNRGAPGAAATKNIKWERTIKEVTNILTDYKFAEKLGSGAFGDVYKAQHRRFGVDVAIKKISKEKISKVPIYMKLMQSELKALLDVNHPNTLRIMEILQDNKFYYVVSEIMKGGELFDRIVK